MSDHVGKRPDLVLVEVEGRVAGRRVAVRDRSLAFVANAEQVPAPAQSLPKLIPVITTGRAVETIELAQTYFQRWNCQENSIRDWLIPLNLDTNHGYAKEPVENSELTKELPDQSETTVDFEL